MEKDYNFPLYLTIDSLLTDRSMSEEEIGKLFTLKLSSIICHNNYSKRLFSNDLPKKIDSAKKEIIQELREYFSNIDEKMKKDPNFLKEELDCLEYGLRESNKFQLTKRIYEEVNNFSTVTQAIMKGSKGYCEDTRNRRASDINSANTHLKIEYNKIIQELEKLVY